MFEQTFVGDGKTKKSWTVLAAFAGQIAFISVLIVLPMVFFEGLPQATFQAFLTAPSTSPRRSPRRWRIPCRRSSRRESQCAGELSLSIFSVCHGTTTGLPAGPGDKIGPTRGTRACSACPAGRCEENP